MRATAATLMPQQRKAAHGGPPDTLIPGTVEVGSVSHGSRASLERLGASINQFLGSWVYQKARMGAHRDCCCFSHGDSIAVRRVPPLR